MVELLPSGQGVNYGAILPFALFVHIFSPRLADGTIELREIEVKRLVTVVIPAIFLVVSVLLGLTDTHISVAGTSIPDNKTTASPTKASDSSASAITMIAWTTPSGEGGSNEL